MNRLKKSNNSPQKPISNTLSHALAVRPPLQVNPPQATPPQTLSALYQTALQPRTNAEQYWAARALSAETLLAARLEHQRELRSFSYDEECKRARELAAHDARHAKLERLVLALLAALFLLVLALLNLAGADSSAARGRKVPAHFTIPILSPFTSVIEHETSVIGSKTLAIFAFVLAGLAYFVFRHWLARRRQHE
ncbi:hypothetical protein B0H17DRAFT_1004815 [Mycena rosella]|uniref:Uncharacterized protein n=1 Tax=Mycena rosella TaxID=1033263 RepID=A0AAD7DX78_MYCRO|nr:hypothetical protein B0H17DRAFT_1004815 [Mycena rosella]